MSEQASVDSEELVIIRRRSAFNEVEYKSGVWKIAYADFMTAMMAFFLVMWLINATNQETRESVASYFNPVKLADSTPDRKGLEDPKKKEPAPPSAPDMPDAEPAAPVAPAPSAPSVRLPNTPSSLRAPRFDESALFRDPYAILTDIAGGPAVKASRERRVGISLRTPDRDDGGSGQAHRDPFDPIYWQLAPQASTDEKAARSGDRGSLPIDEDLAALGAGELTRPTAGQLDVAAGSGRPARPSAQDASPDAGKADAAVAATSAPTSADAKKHALEQPPREPPTPEARPVKAADSETRTNTRDAAAELQEAIRSALRSGPAPGPAVEVQRTDEGVLVSLTDAADFGMFAVGSAEPQPELVRVVDKIAPLLAERKGAIVVRGHTDARPYRSVHYDNWRLSTARAHMAYHMLVRGGIAPQRIERIEGYADRRPKQTDDPLAAQNRRIEILVKERAS
jgi:chemotaxis protein MotB